MDNRGGSFIGGQDRARYGSITTWENARGETLNLHRFGPMQETMKRTIAEVLRIDPTYRLVSYSTPDTILTDLRENRRDAKGTHAHPIALPEVVALAKAGRRDLLHPRLFRATSQSGERKMAVDW